MFGDPAHILRRHRHVLARGVDLCRQDAVVAQRARHRFVAAPGGHHPDRNARLLHGRRRGIEVFGLDGVVLARVGEGLPAPQAGDDVEALVQQLGPGLALGDFAKLGEAGVDRAQSNGRVVGMVAGSLSSTETTGAGLSGFIYGDRLISAHCSNPTLVVPIERAQEIAAELKAYGRVMRGFLGVQMQTSIEPPPPGRGQRGRLGVMINRVQPGGPADVAGLRPGDRIVRYSGSDVRVPDELTFLITSKS